MNFNTTFKFRAPEHFVDSVREAAAKRMTTPSEFIRQAVRAELIKEGIGIEGGECSTPTN